MPRFAYTAWFRDLTLPPDDQDHEWPACFLVEAACEERALAWGDHLARRHAATSGEPFFRSYVELPTAYDEGVFDSSPIVRDGQEATDDEIGW